MTNEEAIEWLSLEISCLRHLRRPTQFARTKLEAYEAAVEALKTAEQAHEKAEANTIRPYWYGKLKELNDG